MELRRYQQADCKELTELFYNTVHIVNAKDYTEEQLNVWATRQVDSDRWNLLLQKHYSIVAVENDRIVGFEQSVPLSLSKQDAVRHELNRRPGL